VRAVLQHVRVLQVLAVLVQVLALRTRSCKCWRCCGRACCRCRSCSDITAGWAAGQGGAGFVKSLVDQTCVPAAAVCSAGQVALRGVCANCTMAGMVSESVGGNGWLRVLLLSWPAGPPHMRAAPTDIEWRHTAPTPPQLLMWCLVVAMHAPATMRAPHRRAASTLCAAGTATSRACGRPASVGPALSNRAPARHASAPTPRAQRGSTRSAASVQAAQLARCGAVAQGVQGAWTAE
jgi:hypothetical protein